MLRVVATKARAASELIRLGGARSLVTLTDSASLQQAVDEEDVLVFSKTTCGFCAKTKKIFEALGQEATVYELDKLENGFKIQQLLEDMTNQRTVPNVFVKQQHIGGNSDTYALFQSGKLKEMLE